jgi:2-polyprenyl-3-methyl-5-hydroxy-6-metoxy-1,4-benzoquinol methylase
MTQDIFSDCRIDTCLICDSRSIKSLVGYEKDYLSRCEKCGLVFSNQRPTQNELDEVYGRYSWENIERSELTLAKMRETAKMLIQASKPKKVLDIGCGDGVFLGMFKSVDCEVFGTEYDKKNEDLCRAKEIIMFSGDFLHKTDSNLKNNFDLIILTEVIEHINNPKEVIANTLTLLKPGGLLYITTPNFSSIERQIIGSNWSLICYPEHLCYYNPKTLDFFFSNCGYEKVLLRTENISVASIIKFLKKKKILVREFQDLPHDKFSSIAQQYVHKNKFLIFIKKMVNTFLGITGKGTSLVALYRKPEKYTLR